MSPLLYIKQITLLGILLISFQSRAEITEEERSQLKLDQKLKNAIVEGDDLGFLKLLELGAKPSNPNSALQPLILAIENQRYDMVEVLLDRGANTEGALFAAIKTSNSLSGHPIKNIELERRSTQHKIIDLLMSKQAKLSPHELSYHNEEIRKFINDKNNVSYFSQPKALAVYLIENNFSRSDSSDPLAPSRELYVLLRSFRLNPWETLKNTTDLPTLSGLFHQLSRYGSDQKEIEIQEKDFFFNNYCSEHKKIVLMFNSNKIRYLDLNFNKELECEALAKEIQKRIDERSSEPINLPGGRTLKILFRAGKDYFKNLLKNSKNSPWDVHNPNAAKTPKVTE